MNTLLRHHCTVYEQHLLLYISLLLEHFVAVLFNHGSSFDGCWSSVDAKRTDRTAKFCQTLSFCCRCDNEHFVRAILNVRSWK